MDFKDFVSIGLALLLVAIAIVFVQLTVYSVRWLRSAAAVVPTIPGKIAKLPEATVVAVCNAVVQPAVASVCDAVKPSPPKTKADAALPPATAAIAGVALVRAAGKTSKLVTGSSKLGGQAMARAGFASASKYIPGVGACVNYTDGVYRLWSGDYVKGLCCFVSGTVSLVPVWGTAASVAIDIAVVTDDVIRSE